MTSLITVTGKEHKPPLFDPVVAAHYNNSASYVEALVQQINDEHIYAPFFKDKSDLTFLDIGANIGLVSIYAYDACKRICAVEPAQQTFDVLNSMTLGLPRIELLKAALTPVDGWTEFFVNDQNSTASSTVNTFGTKTLVSGLTLTGILNHFQLEYVDVCKIDCEGGEGDSLTFKQLSSVAHAVHCFYVEVHNCPRSTWEQKMGNLVTFFSGLGYKTQTHGMTVVAKR